MTLEFDLPHCVTLTVFWDHRAERIKGTRFNPPEHGGLSLTEASEAMEGAKIVIRALERMGLNGLKDLP